MGVRVSAVKQPHEVLLKGIDFSGTGRLAEGDTLVVAGSEVYVYDEDGVDVSDTMVVSGSFDVNIENSTVSVLVQGGTSGKEYKISFRINTIQGETLEEDIVLPVEDL